MTKHTIRALVVAGATTVGATAVIAALTDVERSRRMIEELSAQTFDEPADDNLAGDPPMPYNADVWRRHHRLTY